nr:MAG: hypothetical protein [Bacteriophage sp.]
MLVTKNNKANSVTDYFPSLSKHSLAGFKPAFVLFEIKKGLKNSLNIKFQVAFQASVFI